MLKCLLIQSQNFWNRLEGNRTQTYGRGNGGPWTFQVMHQIEKIDVQISLHSVRLLVLHFCSWSLT